MSKDNISDSLVFDSTVVSGDKGAISLFNDDILIHVNTSRCYRIVVYKIDSKIDLS